jgi:uncharacterized protein YdhG (YjbR/CyaY superfamily)
MAEVKTVDDYLAALPSPERSVLERVRRAINEAAPDAEEKLAYRIPLYRHHGDVVGFAAFRNHLSLFVTDSSVGQRFADQLEGFKVKRTTVHFSVDTRSPTTWLERLFGTASRKTRPS